jgi:BON domain
MQLAGRILALFGVVLLVAACATSAKTTGEQIDDGFTTAAVKAKLAGDRPRTLSEIKVTTQQGVVTLSGLVDDEALRQRAEHLTSQVKGVHGIVNNIAVRQAETASTPAPASVSAPLSTSDSDTWRVADPTLRGSAEELRARAVREAAIQNRPVAYERADGAQRVEAYPLTTPARGGCRWIKQRVFDKGQLVDDRSTEVCS